MNDMRTPLLVRRMAVTSLRRRTTRPSFFANASAMRLLLPPLALDRPRDLLA
jgi:hypothetical protein